MVATSLCQSAGRYPPPHGILKENLLWVKTFDTIEELRAALIEFATRYNETWLVAATVIVPQPRCEPLKASLIRTQSPI